MLDEHWALSASVALRPEPFGALAYNFDNRRLTFLKRPELVALVRDLAEQRTVREALAAQAIPTKQWPVYLEALEALAHAELIAPVRDLAHA